MDGREVFRGIKIHGERGLMIKLLWWLLEIFDDNWGYSTSIQKRYKVGDKVLISSLQDSPCGFKVGQEVTIDEIGRHDYLIENSEYELAVVYQHQLCDIGKKR